MTEKEIATLAADIAWIKSILGELKEINAKDHERILYQIDEVKEHGTTTANKALNHSIDTRRILFGFLAIVGIALAAIWEFFWTHITSS